jgi:DNA-binding response OmpR family regulator
MARIPETSPQPTMLIVDDNAANRALAQQTLEDEGYRVVLASGGEEALALFAKDPADCVLLDVRMPGLDGFAVCERIRAQAEGAETPVVFLTELRDVDTFDHALRSGGDDFLTKPVRLTELVIRVQSALKLRQLRSALRLRGGASPAPVHRPSRGTARTAHRWRSPRHMPCFDRRHPSSLDALLRPRSVAVVGASRTRTATRCEPHRPVTRNF